MSCEHTRKLLDPYLDDELDLEKNLEIERHLAACPACRDFHAARRSVRTAVKTQTTYFTLPDSAAHRMRAQFGQRAAPGPALSPRWLNLAATAALAALLGAGVTWWIGTPSSEDRLAREAVANHSRSLMVAGRITDISSSDQHAVKPWFNGRIDYSPPVVDLTGKGFALVGGRLDYLDSRPVAALVYRHRQHVINLFVLPEEVSANTAIQASSRQGYHVLRWSREGMHYWAVSDLNLADLMRFGALLATPESG